MNLFYHAQTVESKLDLPSDSTPRRGGGGVGMGGRLRRPGGGMPGLYLLSHRQYE